MKKILTALLTGLATLTMVGMASADTLDFTEYSPGWTDVEPMILSNAIIDGSDFYIFAPNTSGWDTNSKGSICSARGASCDADWQIEFLADVSNLFFATDGANSGDSVEVFAYFEAAFLGSIVVETDTIVDMSSFGPIDRLFFDDSSTGAGFVYNDFSFDTVSAVPLPAGFPLYGAGLAVMGFLGWRRKQRLITA